MPHLVILYTPQIEAEIDMNSLCRRLADAMLSVKDEHGKSVFPIGGTRVFAVQAAHYAVADGSGDHAFMYFSLRMNLGRSEVAKKNTGEVVTAAAREFLAPLLARRAVGLTLQVDEGEEVFDAKFGNLHPLFAKP
jgi:5-carboxymethyl-2-hydroxymuconate isomerase